MKKSLIALAIVSSFAGSAFAQSNVQVYGTVDAGLEMVSSGGVDTTKLESGMNGGSHIGFKGTEDLGGGLKAEFLLESGVSLDTGANTQGSYFGRQSYIGVSSNAGTVRLGNQYSPIRSANVALDPFARVGAGNSTRILGNGSLAERTANAVTYISPEVSGLQGTVQYGLGETADSTSDNSYVGLGVTYKSGPLMLTLAHGQQNVNGVGVDEDRKDLQVGGTYDFGMAKGFVSYLESKATDSVTNTSAKAEGYLVGVTVPMGAHSFMASYASNKIKGAADTTSNQFAVGYNYSLSKRTSAYASVAHVTNDNNAGLAGASANGENVNRYQVGLRHSF